MAIKVDMRLIKRRMKNSQGFVTTAIANDAYIGDSRSKNILKNGIFKQKQSNNERTLFKQSE